jgi:hypothetical protein
MSTADQLDAIPLEIMAPLAEKFFSHFHLATLVAHKETFLADMNARRVPLMLSLAIAAISAKYRFLQHG